MNTPITITQMLLPAICTIFGVAQDAEHTYFGTAAHCVPEVGQIVIVKHPTDPNKKIEARVIEKDKANDTAILKTWTKDVGQIKTTALKNPEPTHATIESWRGSKAGDITDGMLHIPGLTPRRVSNIKVIPGDSGAPVIQDNHIVGVLSHSVGDCQSGFCPAIAPRNVGNGLIDRIETDIAQKGVKELTDISLRDILIAIASIFGWTWFNKPKPPAA